MAYEASDQDSSRVPRVGPPKRRVQPTALILETTADGIQPSACVPQASAALAADQPERLEAQGRTAEAAKWHRAAERVLEATEPARVAAQRARLQAARYA